MTRAVWRIVVLGIAGLLASVLPVPAAAQGFAPPADGYYYVPLWQGLYVGAHLGYGDADPGDGFLGGVHAGYSWQSGRLVYGLEADATWADISEEETITACIGPGSCVSGRLESSIDWMATLRGRVGFLLQPDLLPYVTAGFGLVSGSASASIRAPGFNSRLFSDDDTETAFVYGIGLEGRLSSVSLWRIEYLAFDDAELDVIRAGLSFRLGN